MEDHDVLDNLEERSEALSPQRRRSFRFLFYAIGIGSVMLGRMWLLLKDNGVRSIDFDSVTIMRLFFLGLAGIWLFTGLGAVASIRALRENKIDALQVGTLAAHGLLLAWSSVQLWFFLLRLDLLGVY